MEKKHITKKEFKERCSFHVYGTGHRRTNVIYYDWLDNLSPDGEKDSLKGRGYKYALAAPVRSVRKNKLFNALYAWVTNYGDRPDPWNLFSSSFGVKYAPTDMYRFKVPIALTGFHLGTVNLFNLPTIN